MEELIAKMNETMAAIQADLNKVGNKAAQARVRKLTLEFEKLGGGQWLFVDASRFEDVEQLNEYQGNMEMPAELIEKFTAAIDPAYLKGYLGLNMAKSQHYDRNSGANQLNRLFGLNQQGTETVRVSMYGNRYPYLKAFDLFGVIKGYGAQMPE